MRNRSDIAEGATSSPDPRRVRRRWLARALVALYAAALLLAIAAVAAPHVLADTLTAPTGYKLAYDVTKPGGDAKPLPVVLIFMHGKNGANDSPAMRAFARGFADAGIAVYLPSMPWSRKWDGTVVDATAALDALAALASDNGAKRVIVGGQSMGASFALGWHPADPPAYVAGKLLTSPGHMLDLFPPQSMFWKTILPSLEKAKALIAEGKGGEMARFEGSNTSGTQSVQESYQMRPEVYASFHDVETYPSLRKALPATKLPVYWGVGSRDPAGGGKKPSFDRLPANAQSVYSEIDGDHNSIMRDALPAMIAWAKSLK